MRCRIVVMCSMFVARWRLVSTEDAMPSLDKIGFTRQCMGFWSWKQQEHELPKCQNSDFISLNQFSIHGRGALRERIVAALVLFDGSTVVVAFCATKGQYSLSSSSLPNPLTDGKRRCVSSSWLVNKGKVFCGRSLLSSKVLWVLESLWLDESSTNEDWADDSSRCIWVMWSWLSHGTWSTHGTKILPDAFRESAHRTA